MARKDDARVAGAENIILIGMPGAGKSTLGVLLAEALGAAFIDTDRLIEAQEGCSLQDIVDTRGYLRLRAIEEAVILACRLRRQVVATGGSAAYSDAAMRHLRAQGVVIYLYVPFAEIERRVQDFISRGIARRPDQSFFDLFQERSVLYNRYADITIDGMGSSPEALVKRVCGALRERKCRNSVRQPNEG